MGNIEINKLSKDKKIGLVARSEVVSKRGVQVVSPINGKKKIIDFGTDLKNLNLTVYSNNLSNFKEGDYLKLFSDKFVGDVKAENVNISQYSSLPYSIITISAIGEDNNNTIKKTFSGISYKP
jgi:hypothetical protein